MKTLPIVCTVLSFLLLLYAYIMAFAIPTNSVRLDNLAIVTTEYGNGKTISYVSDFKDVSNFAILCENCEISKIEYDSASIDKNFTKYYVSQATQNRTELFIGILCIFILSTIYTLYVIFVD